MVVGSDGYPLPMARFFPNLAIALSRETFARIDAAETVTNLLSA
ncbi:uncharacterized protein METZ01_LOCUS118522 [marine metagenome]|uniref:Uncharacterized protein n=1 Tax=marine metagenome TaxID=408172 RepID=A0A381XLP5_9ZZZZ